MGLVWDSFAYCPELKSKQPRPDRTGKRPSLLVSNPEKGKLLDELESVMRADFSLKFRSSWGN